MPYVSPDIAMQLSLKDLDTKLIKSQRVLHGLAYLMDISHRQKKPMSICAEHDIIYAGVDDVEMTKEDQQIMAKLSWSESEDFGWETFV